MNIFFRKAIPFLLILLLIPAFSGLAEETPIVIIPMGSNLKTLYDESDELFQKYPVDFSHDHVLNAFPHSVIDQLISPELFVFRADGWEMYSSSPGFAALRESGLPADLSSLENVRNSVEMLPQGMQNLTDASGKIVAVPLRYSLSGWQILFPQEEALTAAGLTTEDIPSTLPELLDALTVWYQEGRLSSVRLFDQADQEKAMVLFVLRNCLLYEMDLSGDSMKEIMEKLDNLRIAMKEHGCQLADAPYLFSCDCPPTEMAKDSLSAPCVHIRPGESIPGKVFFTLSVLVPRPDSLQWEPMKDFMNTLAAVNGDHLILPEAENPALEPEFVETLWLNDDFTPMTRRYLDGKIDGAELLTQLGMLRDIILLGD